MANRSEQRKGELFIFSEASLFGFFPIAVVFTYATISSFMSLAWSTLFAAITFSIVMSFRGRWRELKNPTVWKHSIFITIFIGILFYGFFFVGLEHTTPGNAAIIVLFEVFTTFLFFNMYRREHISRGHKIGAALMIIGAVVILARNFSGVNIGDFFILGATLFTPLGNYFQREARKLASSETIMFLRSALTAAVLFSAAYILGAFSEASDVLAALPFLLLSGVVFLGFAKVLWIEGIHRISVTKAIALSSVTPFFTLLFAWVFLQQVPTVWQLLALPPLVLGILLLTDQIKLKKNKDSFVR